MSSQPTNNRSNTTAVLGEAFAKHMLLIAPRLPTQRKRQFTKAETDWLINKVNQFIKEKDKYLKYGDITKFTEKGARTISAEDILRESKTVNEFNRKFRDNRDGNSLVARYRRLRKPRGPAFIPAEPRVMNIPAKKRSRFTQAEKDWVWKKVGPDMQGKKNWTEIRSAFNKKFNSHRTNNSISQLWERLWYTHT